nr:caspase family protein [uncultured Mucilaginibacter sp.]
MKKLLQILTLFIATSTFAQTGNLVAPTGGRVSYVIADKQGKYIYTVGGGKIIMWDRKRHIQLRTFQNKTTFEGRERLYPVSLTEDGETLIDNSKARFGFSTVTGEDLEFPYGKVKKGTNEAYSYDTKGLVKTDLETFQTELYIPDPEAKLGLAVTRLLNGGTQMMAYSSDVFKLWDLQKKVLLSSFKFAHTPYEVYYIQRTGRVVVFSGGGTPIYDVYDVDTGKLLTSHDLEKTHEFSFCVSEEGNQIITLSESWESPAFLKVYDIEGWVLKKTIPVPKHHEIYFFSEKENSVLVGDSPISTTLFTFDLSTHSLTPTYESRLADLRLPIKTYNDVDIADRKKHFNLQYFANSNLLTLDTRRMMPLKVKKLKPYPKDWHLRTDGGDTVAYTEYGEGAFLKNIATGKLLPKMDSNWDVIGDNVPMFFSKDGNWIYYQAEDKVKEKRYFRKMNLKTGLKTNVLTYKITDKAFITEDQKAMIAREWDDKGDRLTAWNLQTGQVITSLPYKGGFDDPKLQYLALSADKKRLMVLIDSYIKIYDVATKALLSTSQQIVGNESWFVNKDLSLLVGVDNRGYIMGFDPSGRRVFSAQTSTQVRNVSFLDDHKTLITNNIDGAVQAFDIPSKKLYGTFYQFKGSEDWVFIAPTGHFDGTEGGMKRLYYLSRRNVIPLDKIYEKAYTPHLYERLYAGETFQQIDIKFNALPVARISYSEIARNLNVVEDKVQTYNNATGVAEITVNATAENDRIEEIRLFHNGKIVNLATRGLFVTDNNTGTDTKKYIINLLPGVNNIRAVALNSQRTESEPDEIMVNYKGAGQSDVPTPSNTGGNGFIAQVDKNATIHLIVVGINAYKNPKMSLNYALADATAFKNEAEKDAKTIATNLKTYFVTDAQADKNGITAAFAEVKRNAKPQDVFVFYYAGHGVISDKNKEFYLVPTDVTDLQNVDEALAKNGIPSSMLQRYAIDIPAQKQVFILDACQSAGAFQQLMSNDANQQKNLAVVARSTGTHWIAASGSQQFAQEFGQLGHGAFTYVLLKAMQGEAASNKMITVNGLKNFLQIQLPGLMKKYNGAPQYPASYGYGNDFPIQVIR